MKKALFITAAALLALTACNGAKQAAGIKHPLMGWSSWNTLALDINEQNICANADAQVSTGLRDAGYVYCNIDDGYMGGRDADSIITGNDKLFPNGMKHVADYIRSKGLKPGIYNDAAGGTCGHWNFAEPGLGADVGLHGHELEDCRRYFGEWGYDFIKVDYCGARDLRLPEKETYTAIGDAIKAVGKELGKPISFNICRWAYPGTWCKDVADSWRISYDVAPSWGSFKYVISKNRYLSAYCGDGHYNDMDMLEIGKGLPLNEEEVHMGMWCIQSSPLLAGCDMTKIPEPSLELMKNPELIAINQDNLGLQAYIVWQKGNSYVYVKDILQKGGKARVVALLNLGEEDADFNLPLSKIDMKGSVKLRDLIRRADIPAQTDTLTARVPAHGIKVWTVRGKRTERSVYDAGTAYLPLFNDLGYDPDIIRYREDSLASGGVKVIGLGGSEENVMEWRDINVKKAGKYIVTVRYACAGARGLKVSVNGVEAVSFSGLDSGGERIFAEQDFEVSFEKSDNTLSLGNASGKAPDIDGIVIKRK